MRVLVVNAGSSSLKLSLLDGDDATLAAVELAAPRAEVDDGELRTALREHGLGEADAVGHRIVHGGMRFTEAASVDHDVEAALRELVDLAPLHQPKSLAALDAVCAALPGLPTVVCFDTSFHATIPEPARTYAVPAAWRERWDLRGSRDRAAGAGPAQRLRSTGSRGIGGAWPDMNVAARTAAASSASIRSHAT